MKVIVTDRLVLSRVRTDRIVRYLKSRGWTRLDSTASGASYWHNKNSEEIEILVPDGEWYRDYAQRVADLLGALEIHERRSQLYILQDLRLGRLGLLRRLLFIIALPVLLVVVALAPPFATRSLWWDVHLVFFSWLYAFTLSDVLRYFLEPLFESRGREKKPSGPEKGS